ncbi:MAG: hypothetical protein R3B68_15740 [Phycisphaerales bacterium]
MMRFDAIDPLPGGFIGRSRAWDRDWQVALDRKEIQPGMERWIEAICSTCGLVHDLGNPPFGHSGEDAIRHWFQTRVQPPIQHRRPGIAKSGVVLADLRSMLSNNEQLIQDFLKFEGNAQSRC